MSESRRAAAGPPETPTSPGAHGSHRMPATAPRSAPAVKRGGLPALRRALRTLLAPRDHATPRRWLHAAAVSMAPVLGADAASGFLPLDSGLVATSDSWDDDSLTSYPSARKELAGRWELPDRELELGVFSRARVYGPRLRSLYRSAYYNEFLRPQRAYDGIGIAVPVPGGSRPAYLLYHHHRPHGRRFGRRGLGLLGIVRPAFAAAVTALVRASGRGGERRAAGRALDAVGRPLVVVGLDGAWIHATPAAVEALDAVGRPVRDRLEAGIRRLAGELRDLLLRGRWDGRPPETAVELGTPRAAYRLVARLSAPDAFGPERAAVVEVMRRERASGFGELVREHGLTEREAEVALLLARRRTAAEIADELGVTVHTARRHTERVLRKLGVHSKLDVEDVFRRFGVPPAGPLPTPGPGE